MTGDRMDLRAEVESPGGLARSVRITGPSGVHRGRPVERLDGPATAVLVIDETMK